VTGQTAEGCDESESVEISGGGPRPRKTFSPNGDGLNDCWEIVNSSGLTGCEVYILDTRGAIVFKTELPLDPVLPAGPDCIWEGDFNGKDVPEGVYFFVVKCTDGSQNLSGSILVAR
jgi:gliding motility-associated-like protein